MSAAIVVMEENKARKACVEEDEVKDEDKYILSQQLKGRYLNVGVPSLLVGRNWRKHVADLNDGKLEHDSKPPSVAFKHPGLNLNHFDRESNPNISPVMKFMIELRNCGLLIPYDGNDQYFIDWPNVKENSLIFLSSSVQTFSRAFYEMKIAKWPLDVKLYLDHVGNSSISLYMSIFPSRGKEPIATQTISMVFIDRETRRPKKLSDWFISKYKGQGVSNTPCRVDTLTKPQETWQYKVQVMWSDTDANNHTNFSSYVQFAVNGLRRAAQLREKSQSQGLTKEEEINSAKKALLCLHGISSQVLRNGIKSVKLCFVKESAEGDMVDIHLWQESGNELSVFCVAESLGQPLCHLQLEYFCTSSHL